MILRCARWFLIVGLVLGTVVSAAGESSDPLSVIDALITEDRWREALAQAQRFCDKRPDDAGARAALAEALFRAGEVEQAEILLAEPIVNGGDRRAEGRAASLRGLLLAARGRHVEGIESMERALEAAPEDRIVLWRSSEVTADRAEAIARLSRYLERSAGEDEDRVVAARGTLDVLRQLGDRPVWTPISTPDRVEVPLKRIWLGPGRLMGCRVKVRLGTRRKPLWLLLDTGSSGLFLEAGAAQRRGFTELAEEITFGGGGDRRHRSARGLFERFELGELVFADALAVTTATDLDPEGRFQGVVGLSVFDGYRITLDFQRGRMILDREPLALDSSPYWTLSGQMLVRAGVPSGAEGLFLFDTGATTTILDLGFAGDLPLARIGEPAPMRGYGGSVASARAIHGARLEFQERMTPDGELRAVDLSMRSRLGRVRISGFLGIDLMDGALVVIDTRERRLSLRNRESRGSGGRRGTRLP